jgi:hypothetical protein
LSIDNALIQLLSFFGTKELLSFCAIQCPFLSSYFSHSSYYFLSGSASSEFIIPTSNACLSSLISPPFFLYNSPQSLITSILHVINSPPLFVIYCLSVSKRYLCLAIYLSSLFFFSYSNYSDFLFDLDVDTSKKNNFAGFVCVLELLSKLGEGELAENECSGNLETWYSEQLLKCGLTIKNYLSINKTSKKDGELINVDKKKSSSDLALGVEKDMYDKNQGDKIKKPDIKNTLKKVEDVELELDSKTTFSYISVNRFESFDDYYINEHSFSLLFIFVLF